MIENREEAEIAAEVIADLLHLINPNNRLDALAIATKAEEAERRNRKENGGFAVYNAAEIDWARYWNAKMRFKARVVCTFVRNITNNHSPKVAGQLLFKRQPAVPGSGYLGDYLDLPRPGEAEDAA